MGTPRVQFDSGPLGNGTLFAAPRRIITATTPAAVPGALMQMQDAQRQGYWLAGYASYELGLMFSTKLRDLMPDQLDTPLLAFGVFDAPVACPPPVATADSTLRGLAPSWDAARYAQAFAAIKDYIGAGDIYQANLTFALTGAISGTPEDLYTRLHQRQPVQYGAYVDLAGPVLLSRSPELFFAKDAAGRLTARPMKGTAPRGGNPAEDAAQAKWLATSEKNRAENLMIVDLLRNDISRISEIGSVRVPELFAIETYATLHQMTSRITADVRAGTSIAEIFAALFPCGSITGAPKIRAMQILHEQEAAPRGPYCGAIGWIAPDSAMSFSVAIRTLVCNGGAASLSVGGGVVYDSTPEGEYAEALLKARFAMFEGQTTKGAPNGTPLQSA